MKKLPLLLGVIIGLVFGLVFGFTFLDVYGFMADDNYKVYYYQHLPIFVFALAALLPKIKYFSEVWDSPKTRIVLLSCILFSYMFGITMMIATQYTQRLQSESWFHELAWWETGLWYAIPLYFGLIFMGLGIWIIPFSHSFFLVVPVSYFVFRDVKNLKLRIWYVALMIYIISLTVSGPWGFGSGSY